MSNDLNYYTNSEKDDTIGHVLFVKLDKAINEVREIIVSNRD